MTATRSFTLPLPPSANRYWRKTKTGKVYLSEAAQVYRIDVGLRLRRQRPATGPVAMTVRIYRERMTGDLDNRLKILFDALRGKLYLDDDQIVEIHAFRDDDKNDPRAEIEITEL